MLDRIEECVIQVRAVCLLQQRKFSTLLVSLLLASTLTLLLPQLFPGSMQFDVVKLIQAILMNITTDGR